MRGLAVFISDIRNCELAVGGRRGDAAGEVVVVGRGSAEFGGVWGTVTGGDSGTGIQSLGGRDATLEGLLGKLWGEGMGGLGCRKVSF